MTLSGGQRQRLAIARALVANPRVLILDDATSSVDASTEQSIKLALARAMAGRTTFVIAHRLSTIELADQIVVLDHGQIVAQGSHDELLETLRALPRDRRRHVFRRRRGGAHGREPAGGQRRRRSERRGSTVSTPAKSANGGGRGRAGGSSAFGPGGPRAVLGPGARGGHGWAGERPSRGSRGRNLRGLLELLRPYRMRTAAMLVALLLGTAASLAPPLLAKLAIDAGIVKHDIHTLVLVVLAFLVSALLVWVATYAQTYLVGWVGQRALADLRIRIFKHLQSQPIGFYESRPAGVLISRMTNDVEALESLVTDSVVTLFQSGLTLLGAIGVLLYLDVKLALLTFCVVPFVAAASIWFRLISAGAFRRTRETIGSITGYLQETLSGIRVVRSFGQEPAHEARFAELDEDNREANMVTVRLNATYFPAVEMLSGVALALIVLYGGYQAIDGNITVGTIVAFVATLSFLFEPIQQLSQLYTTYQSGMAALEKIFQLLDVKPTLEDAPDAPAIGPIRGEVRFEDVSFAYKPRSQRRKRDGSAPPGEPDVTARGGPEQEPAASPSPSPSPRRCSRSSTSTLTCRPARRSRSLAPPERASRRWPSSPPASTTPPAGACSSTITTCARSRATRCARRWGSCRRRRSCSRERCARTSPSDAPTPTTPRFARRPRPSAPTSSSRSCPAATTPRSASAARSSQPDSAS